MLKVVVVGLRATLVAAVGALAGTTHADAASPSFPCNGRLLPTEALICSDEGLAMVDRQLAFVYENKFRSLAVGERQDLQASEDAWRMQRDSCRTDKSCISNAYQRRIAVLGGSSPPPRTGSPIAPKPPAQTPFPGVRPALQNRAVILGQALYFQRYLKTCRKMFPGVPQFDAAFEALGNVTTDLQEPFSQEELQPIFDRLESVYQKFEPLLTMNTNAYAECSKASRYVGIAISTGMYRATN